MSCIFFSMRVFFTDTFIPLAHQHWEIYLQLCMWDDYHVFLIATLVFTRLLLDEIYHLIELPSEWLDDDAMFVCLLEELILGFCYSDLTLEIGGFELGSTIIDYPCITSKPTNQLYMNTNSTLTNKNIAKTVLTVRLCLAKFISV